MLTAKELIPNLDLEDIPLVQRRAWLTVEIQYDGNLAATSGLSLQVATKSGRKISPDRDLTPLPPGKNIRDERPLSAGQLDKSPKVPRRRGGVDSRGMGGSDAAPHPPGVISPSPGVEPGEGDQGGGGVRATLIAPVGPIQPGDTPMSNPRSARLSRGHRAGASS